MHKIFLIIPTVIILIVLGYYFLKSQAPIQELPEQLQTTTTTLEVFEEPEIKEELITNPYKIKWTKSNGPGGGKIIDVAIDPYDSNTLYTATYPLSTGLLDGGIYKSTNGGISWERKINGINDKETWSITMDPTDNQVLWAGTNAGEIYKTTNAADSWELKKELSGDIENPTSDTIYSVEIDPFNSNNILAGSRHGNLYRTEDGGATWETIYNDKGLTATGVISDITYDPKNEGVVYLTTGFFDVWDFIGTGIYKSFDGGETWKHLDVDGKTQFGDLVIDPSDSDVIYAANGMETNRDLGVIGEDLAYLYRSDDAGETWERIDIGEQCGHRTLNAVAVHPENPNRIYVLGQDQSAFLSEDRGKTWECIVGDPDCPSCRQGSGIIGIGTFVEYDPNDYNVMYATSYAAGIFKSTDGGRTWKDLNGKEISFSYVEGVKADPVRAGTLYTQSFENGFHYSYDYGETWYRGHVSSNYHVWRGLVDKSKVSSDIFVVNRGGGSLKKVESPDGNWIFPEHIESNGGKAFIITLEASDYDRNLVYIGTKENGVFRSKDSGISWQEINNGLPDDADVRTIATDPNDENRIYAGVTGDSPGIYYSDNQGNSWQKLNDDLSFTTIWGHSQLQIDPNDKNIVYAATWGGGTYKTMNGGKDWDITGKGGEEFPAGSFHTYSPTCLAISEKNPNIIYACDRTRPWIHRSTDGGKTWDAYYYFHDHMLTSSVAIDPDNPDIIYASAFKPPLAHQGSMFKIKEDMDKEAIPIGNDLPRSVIEIEIDSFDKNTIYVTTHMHGVYKSTDTGMSWKKLDDQNNGLPRIGIYDIDVDPTNRNILYATALCGELPDYMIPSTSDVQNLDPDGKCGVYKSTDAGENWQLILETVSEARGIDIDPDNHNNLFVADMMGGVWVSRDGGKNWRQENNGLGSISMTSVKVKDNYIYASTQGSGVYAGIVNDDGSIIWDELRSNKPKTHVYNMQIKVDPENSNIIYASGFPGGLLRSDNGGKNWNDKNFLTPTPRIGDPDIRGYYTFSINPKYPENMIVCEFGKGCFFSYDRMDFNIPLNIGMDNKDIYSVDFDASGRYVYVGTNGGSVYRAKITE